jgi:hypothetical protein
LGFNAEKRQKTKLKMGMTWLRREDGDTGCMSGMIITCKIFIKNIIAENNDYALAA